jgi:hypothetical protein
MLILTRFFGIPTPDFCFQKKVGKVFGFFIFGHFFCPFFKNPNTFGKKFFRKIMVREKSNEK